MTNGGPERPKLRSVEAQRIEQEGRGFFLVKDPRRLARQAIVVREELGPFLALADGSLTVDEIIAAARSRFQVAVQDSAVHDLFRQMESLFLLEGPAFEAEAARRLDEYRNADFRTPSLEGQAYPEDPDELLDMFEGFAPGVSSEQQLSGRELRAIVTPHIDYQRGGDSYAELWRRAAPDLEGVELAVVFGTNHVGAGPRLTLTHQSYATPWNIFPTDRDLVGKMARILGADTGVRDHAFADEFDHVHEHSIELASVWLNWAVGDRAVKMLPVLCGSLGEYVQPDGQLRHESPDQHPQIADAIGLLQQVARHRKTVFVAAADLSHVGPAFGDGQAVDDSMRNDVETLDREFMRAIAAGDRNEFLEVARRESDRSRVCGLSPIYMALWAAEITDGEWLGYRQCPADENDTSFVSIAGALLY